MKAIIGGKIILKDRIAENCALLFSDKIEGVVPAYSIPADTEIIDAKGGYVAPGLIDLHIHGYLGKDVCDGEEESIRTISKGILANGVTGYLPTTMTEDMSVIRKALEVCRSLKEESKNWNGSAILGCHAEGPFISESKKGAQDAKYILKPDAAFVKEYADIIKTITLAPEEDTQDFSAIREICRDTDVIVSMGHTSADYETAMAGVNAGVKHATHLFNAMTPLTPRGPGVVGAALASDNVSAEVIADTFHINPGLYSIVAKVKGDKMVLITDCTRAGGMPDGEYDLGGQPIFLKGIECRLADGTIAGSVLKLNNAVKNVLDHTSLPVNEVFKMASLNPATSIHCADRIGSLETGKDADIIIADENINIVRTIKKGRTIYEA